MQSRRVERMPETEELYECRTELYRMQTYIRSYNNFLEQGSSELEARRGTDEDIKNLMRTRKLMKTGYTAPG